MDGSFDPTLAGAPVPAIPALPAFEPGTVWLVGAGPGDPGLLTLLAARALAQADVILHDALVGDAVLALARPGAVVEDAGKRARLPSCRQTDICDRLVAAARGGHRVLRLKGGDPYVFGRGGEEAAALADAGVPFRVVPGVTAGIGGLACAGIPATHRAAGSAVAFVTGHGRNGDLPDNVDWEALARGAPVLVVYMGLRTLGRIADRLMAAGRAPAIVAIGEVVRLHDRVAAWQQIGADSHPVATTRAVDRAATLAADRALAALAAAAG